jgi:chromatin remodeling complex protein RSC6
MSSSVSSSKVNKMVKKSDAVSAPAPAKAAAVAKPAAAKASKAAAAPVPAVAGVTVPVVAAEVRTSDAILTGLQESLRSLQTDVASRLRAAIHEAQEALRVMKREVRDNKRRRKVDPATLSPEDRAAWEARRANNAFLKVRPLTPELCTFMGLPANSKRSQTDVTKFISGYVKSHNCFDPNFKRRILPDAKLGKLLRVTDKDEVSYLNLQTYLKVHFLKPTV